MAFTKGTALQSSLALMKETHGEEGLAAALALLDQPDRLALEAPLAGQWYPLDLFTRWLQASVSVACGGDESRLTERAAMATAKQLKGVYRVFARFASTEAVLERIAVIHRTYFEGVTVDIAKRGAKDCALTYGGFDQRERLLEYILLGWWRQVLSTTRANNPRVAIAVPIVAGKGYCEISLRWE
jgi:hypothetical protein